MSLRRSLAFQRVVFPAWSVRRSSRELQLPRDMLRAAEDKAEVLPRSPRRLPNSKLACPTQIITLPIIYLEQELGVAPDEATTRLYAAIRESAKAKNTFAKLRNPLIQRSRTHYTELSQKQGEFHETYFFIVGNRYRGSGALFAAFREWQERRAQPFPTAGCRGKGSDLARFMNASL